MQTPIIVSIVANVVLMLALLYQVFSGKVIQEYTKRKKLRETQEETRIRKVVEQVLKEIVNEE